VLLGRGGSVEILAHGRYVPGLVFPCVTFSMLMGFLLPCKREHGPGVGAPASRTFPLTQTSGSAEGALARHILGKRKVVVFFLAPRWSFWEPLKIIIALACHLLSEGCFLLVDQPLLYG